MRTTVRIDDDLLAELKQRAGSESLTRVLNDTIRRGIAAENADAVKQTQAFVQRTVDLGKPLINIDKALSILDEMEDIERFGSADGASKDP